jgi:uncharacterized protein YneF (UPF0154 family)
MIGIVIDRKYIELKFIINPPITSDDISDK